MSSFVTGDSLGLQGAFTLNLANRRCCWL